MVEFSIMKFLRLSSRDKSFKMDHHISWTIPMILEHEEIALSSLYITFKPELDVRYKEWHVGSIIPMECSLIANTMWNPDAIIYNVDLKADNLSHESRPGSLGNL